MFHFRFFLSFTLALIYHEAVSLELRNCLNFYQQLFTPYFCSNFPVSPFLECVTRFSCAPYPLYLTVLLLASYQYTGSSTALTSFRLKLFLNYFITLNAYFVYAIRNAKHLSADSAKQPVDIQSNYLQIAFPSAYYSFS